MTGPTRHVVACAHGTDNPEGRRLIDGLRAELQRRLADHEPAIVVHEAYVDVQDPRLTGVLAGLPAGEPAVVAPLLLSEGFHTRVDIAEAVAARPATAAVAPIGAQQDLARVLAERIRAAGWAEGDAVVLASAGTREPRGQEQAREAAVLLSRQLGVPVTAAFCSATEPRVADAVAAARAAGASRVGVASYLLAPGFFHDRLAGSGADYVSNPLLPSVMIAKCVVERLHEAGHLLPRDTE
ncbi:sirohydrochlorin chelatase [Zafaria sp. Z1313]|uniref:sirohydrochlorin chelatase n=1 Tax=Zafaria sp. Z1313 TaxID=3423202 RepID=UPI003D302F7B